jgi:hypothetical protein
MLAPKTLSLRRIYDNDVSRWLWITGIGCLLPVDNRPPMIATDAPRTDDSTGVRGGAGEVGGHDRIAA